MIAVEVAKFLNELNLVEFDEAGVDGDCFIDDMPASPDQAVGIFSTGGFRGDFKFAWDNPTFQVRVRGERDPRVSYERARNIYNALHALGDMQFGNLWLHRLEGLQSDPVSIGRDPQDRFEHVINFEAEVKAPVGNRH